MAKVKKGDIFSCNACGLIITVDEACGCAATELICCEEPMAKGKAAAVKAKKSAPAAKAKASKAAPAKKSAAKKPAAKKAVAKKAAPKKTAAKKPAAKAKKMVRR